jgi:hypothetical protein
MPAHFPWSPRTGSVATRVNWTCGRRRRRRTARSKLCRRRSTDGSHSSAPPTRPNQVRGPITRRNPSSCCSIRSAFLRPSRYLPRVRSPSPIKMNSWRRRPPLSSGHSAPRSSQAASSSLLPWDGRADGARIMRLPRLQPRCRSSGRASRTARSAPARTVAPAPLQKAVPAANGAGRGHEPARAIPQQAAPPPTRDTSTAQQAAASPMTTGAVSRERARMSPRPVPVPETRPTTIEGWTVREVVGGTVVLEGPDGVWRASRGETVPGVGRVDSIVRWGNRWIVATSRGLISTPN